MSGICQLDQLDQLAKRVVPKGTNFPHIHDTYF
jgi:hypothetical protein